MSTVSVIILFVILVSVSNGYPGAVFPDSTYSQGNNEAIARPGFSFGIQPRFNFWDPLNLFGGNPPETSTTAIAVNSDTNNTPKTTIPTTQAPPPAPWNPFGFITGTFNAIGESISNAGTGLVNLVTGGGGTTTTTPFPYPGIANFFSDPSTIITGPKTNSTADPNIVKCLANLVDNYANILIRINNFLPGCISGQTFSAVWLLPNALGLLPVTHLIGVPTQVLNDCKYIDGCQLKMVQTTITEINNAIDGVAGSLRNMWPGVTGLGKGIIECMSRDFATLAKDIPRLGNVTCLQN